MIVASAVSRPLRPRFCSTSFSTCARSTLRACTSRERRSGHAWRPSGGRHVQDQRPVDVQRLIAVREPEVLDRHFVLAILDRGLAAGHVAPLDAVGAVRASARKVELLVVGVEDHAAGGAELSRLLLNRRVELQPLLRVGRRRLQLIELDAADLDERRFARRLHARVDEIQVRDRDRIRAVEIEHLVLAIGEAVAVQRAGRLERRGVARDRAVEGERAVESGLARDPAELGDVGGVDVVLEIRGSARPSASRPDASSVTSGPSTCSRVMSAISPA